jgi:hypothetical protein
MAKGKYDHLFTTEVINKTGYPPFKNMLCHVPEELNFQIRFTHVSIPYKGGERPHTHEYDEVFLFVPCTDDLKAYDAESELYLGEEGERHVINKTTAVHIPAGLLHCPLNHTRVGIPFFFVNCVFAHEYSTWINGKKVVHQFTPIDQSKPK